jgi:hypothetical protein
MILRGLMTMASSPSSVSSRKFGREVNLASLIQEAGFGSRRSRTLNTDIILPRFSGHATKFIGTHLNDAILTSSVVTVQVDLVGHYP